MDLKGVWTGLKAAILATSCCTLPLLLVMAFSVLGAGSMTLALKIPRYKHVFIGLGTIFMLVSLYLTIRKRCGGTCNIKDVSSQKKLVTVTITTYAVLTLLVLYLILPAVSEWIFA